MEVHFNILPDQSKVWMYQSKNAFTEEQQKVIYELAEVFLGEWESHKIPVQGSIDILNNQFIRVAAYTDEPSMCGKAQDGQVRLIKELEQELDLDLTNRMLLAFEIEGAIKILHLNDLDSAIEKAELSSDSTFYNNLIQSKSDYIQNWKEEASKTWLNKYF
jgi:hypothetical protein